MRCDKSFKRGSIAGYVRMRLFSPDYCWEWNGTEWVKASQPIFSPDGKHLWVGEEWIPIPPSETSQSNEVSTNQPRDSQRPIEEEIEQPDGTPEEVASNIPTQDNLEFYNNEKEINDENMNHIPPNENNAIHEVDLLGWELSVVSQDIDGNRVELYDEKRDLTVSDLLANLSDYLELIPTHFGQEEKSIFMITMYLIPPKEQFLPWVIEQNGKEAIEDVYRCSIDEWWMKKVIDRTATGSLYLPNLHFIWYSDSEDISAEGHFGFDVIRQIDLDVNLKIPSISTIDIMQLVVWLVNGKYEKIKQQWHL